MSVVLYSLKMQIVNNVWQTKSMFMFLTAFVNKISLFMNATFAVLTSKMHYLPRTCGLIQMSHCRCFVTVAACAV